MPPVRTTVLARISPLSVKTPTARPPSTRMRSTFVCSKIFAPRIRAPLAKAWVVSMGLVCPSFGRNTPPTTSDVSIRGYSELISSAVRRFTSKPKLFPIDAPRLNSSNRACVFATPMEPFCLKPVAWPVSASSPANSSDVYFASSVMLRVARNCPTSPAACQVVPQVSCLRSQSTTSVIPILVR